MDQIVDAGVVFGRVPREPFLKATALKQVESLGASFDPSELRDE